MIDHECFFQLSDLFPRCRTRHASPTQAHTDIALRYSQFDRSAGRSKYGHCLRHANPLASGGCSRLPGYIGSYTSDNLVI